MQLSIKGAQFIAQFEGFSAKAYVDPATGGEPITIGYGTTVYPNGKKVTLKDPLIIKSQGLDYLMDHVSKKVTPYLNKTFPELEQPQFDSLASFAYNLGTGNLDKSSLKTSILEDASGTEITANFLKWNKANGKVMNGLTKRRTAEAKLYITDSYV